MRLGFRQWNWRPAYWDGKRIRCFSAERMARQTFARRIRWAWDKLSYCERFPLTPFVIKCRIACGINEKVNLP